MADQHAMSSKDEYVAQYLKFNELLADQSQFTDEAFTFLLEFAKIDKGFARNLNKYVGSKIFTREVGETLLILSYIMRPMHRKVHSTLLSQTRDDKDFERFIVNHKPVIGNNYIFNFLLWMCFTFDFVVCGIRINKNYIDTAVRCLSFDIDVLHFHSQGGWNELYRQCGVYSKAYAMVSPIISQELPMQKLLETFFRCSERTLKSNRSLRIPHSPATLLIRNIRKNLMEQYELASNLDPSCITGKYRVKKKITSSQISTLKVDPEYNLPGIGTRVYSLKTSSGDVSPNVSPLETSPKTATRIVSRHVSPGNVSQIPSSLQFSPKTRQQEISPKSNKQHSDYVANIPNNTEKDSVIDTPKSFGETPISAEAAIFPPLDEMKKLLLDEFLPPDKKEMLPLEESSPQVGVSPRLSIVKKGHYSEIKTAEETSNLDPEQHERVTETNDIRSVVNLIDDNMKSGNYVDVGNGICMVFPSSFSIDEKNKAINTYFNKQENYDTSALNNAHLSLDYLCKWVFETRVQQERRATALKSELAAEAKLQTSTEIQSNKHTFF